MIILEQPKVAQLIRLPRPLGAALAEVVTAGDRTSATFNQQIETLRRQHGLRSEATFINYEELAHAFTYKYFAANYAANIALLNECSASSLMQVRTLVDIGCGSGASLFAHLDFISSNGGIDGQVKAIGFDRSKTQLALANDILARARDRGRYEAQQIVPVNRDLHSLSEEHLMSVDGNAWIVLSFVLSELGPVSARYVFRMVLELVHNGACLGATILESDAQALYSNIDESLLGDFRVCERVLDGVEVNVTRTHALKGVEKPKTDVRAHGFVISRR